MQRTGYFAAAGGAQGELWTPADLSVAPVIWLEADDPANFDTVPDVTIWTNFGTGEDMVRGAGTMTYDAANRRVYFNAGYGDCVPNPLGSGGTPDWIGVTAIAVDNPINSRKVVSAGAANNYQAFYYTWTGTGGNMLIGVNGFGNSPATPENCVIDGVAVNFLRHVRDLGNTDMYICLNGASAMTRVGNHAGALNSARFRLGKGVDSSTAGPVWVHACIYAQISEPNVPISGPTADDEVIKIEGYLAHKYGGTAQLAADHPYKDSPPYRSA